MGSEGLGIGIRNWELGVGVRGAYDNCKINNEGAANLECIQCIDRR